LESLSTVARDARPGLHVLALNSGSSSLKFGLYRVGAVSLECLSSGVAESIGDVGASFHATGADGPETLRETTPMGSQRDAVRRIAKFLADSRLASPQAVGHRVVHGGPKLREHCRIDAQVLHTLEAATPFAPLHTPAALEVIRYAEEHFPGLPQVACFDTSFHARMPAVASTLPLPETLRRQGIRRYGFHGLSCESIVHQLGGALPARVIIAHLGNGASITAVRDGDSIDTSMGLTPSGGLIMGTRSGDLDPGVLVYLLRERGFDAAQLEDLIDHRCGLLGISALGGDMRSLHAAAGSNPLAALAIRMFCYAAGKEMAAMAAALGGVDLIVFTGGIGENDAQVRADICARLGCIGVALDNARNLGTTAAGVDTGASAIGAPESTCRVCVLPSQEDEQIARHAWALR
jgi:acetate kinase